MTIFRFSLGDTIYYLRDNKVHSAAVQRRRYIDGEKQGSCFNSACHDYETCHGIVKAEDAFASKAQLLESL